MFMIKFMSQLFCQCFRKILPPVPPHPKIQWCEHICKFKFKVALLALFWALSKSYFVNIFFLNNARHALLT